MKEGRREGEGWREEERRKRETEQERKTKKNDLQHSPSSLPNFFHDLASNGSGCYSSGPHTHAIGHLPCLSALLVVNAQLLGFNCFYPTRLCTRRKGGREGGREGNERC